MISNGLASHDDKRQTVSNPLRRKLLKFSLYGGAVASPVFSVLGKPMLTQAHIVILGVGAAGTAMANRLRRQLSGNKITLVGARQQHIYQPGYTMIASGLWQPQRVLSSTSEWLPKGVDWVAQDVKGVRAGTYFV